MRNLIERDFSEAQFNWRSLREGVAACALDWQQQEQHPEHDVFFLLEFSYGPSWRSQEEGWIDDDLALRLAALDSISDTISRKGEKDFKPEELRESVHWKALRWVAHECLARMPEAPWEN